MRHSSIGYDCDICNKLLSPEEVIRIKSFVPLDGDSTGAYKTLDAIGVCRHCYETHFFVLVDRGPLRCRKDYSNE